MREAGNTDVKKEKIEQALKLIGATNIQPHKRTGWVISRCPLGPWRHEGGESGPEVFGVKIETGDPSTHCFSCGWGGKLSDLTLTMRYLNKKDPHIQVKWSEVDALIEEAEQSMEFDFDSPDIEEMLFGKKAKPHYFPEWWLDSFPDAWTIKKARSYLQERNVPWSVVKALDLRCDTKEERICFPVRDFKGNLVGLHGRAINEGVEPRYRMYTYAGKNNPIHWLGESWVDLTKPILVVEGPFDLASAYRVYRNVVSPLFANPSIEKLHRMADALEWITFFDRGKGGDAGRSRITRYLGDDHVLHHIVPPEGRKDPGECSVEEIAKKLEGISQLDDFLID